jgi:hypothetical protein
VIHEGQSVEQQGIPLAFGNAPYMMAVYRQEGDGRNHVVVRNVYIPLIVNGRRWGDFEVAYSL